MNKNRGIVGTVVLIIVALIILGYFNINFKTVIESPAVQQNLNYAWSLVVQGFVSAFTWFSNFMRNILFPG